MLAATRKRKQLVGNECQIEQVKRQQPSESISNPETRERVLEADIKGSNRCPIAEKSV